METVTIKEMCETISEAYALMGKTISAEDIFCSSPSGELWQIFELYPQAKSFIAQGGNINAKEESTKRGTGDLHGK